MGACINIHRNSKIPPFLRADILLAANTRVLSVFPILLTHNKIYCPIQPKPFSRAAKGSFPSCQRGLFRVSEEPFLRCVTVLPAVRKSLFRVPAVSLRSYKEEENAMWVRFPYIAEAAVAPCRFCFVVFCCQYFLLRLCIIMRFRRVCSGAGACPSGRGS